MTFVPVPPSRAREDPLHDDRLTRMLRAIRPEPPRDIRELIVQTGSTDAVHRGEVRPRPEEIEALCRVDEALTKPAPRRIAVVDDLLATGAHFRAAKSRLSARFPETLVVGLFIARRAPDTDDLDEFDDVAFQVLRRLVCSASGRGSSSRLAGRSGMRCASCRDPARQRRLGGPRRMEDGQWRDDLRGTPQGAVISTILSNIYLHYVLDLWFHRKWRRREVNGDTIIVRYADDFVVGFQHKRDAERFLDAVKARFRSFELELHPDKTRLIEFGRFALANRRRRG